MNGRGYDVRWERGEADDVTKWTYADTGERVVLPPGQSVVGDRSAGKRGRRGLIGLVGAVAFRRAGGEERVHRPPDLVIGVE